MTLGEHIQELRKGQNLSQEALGERLGVTRQSISKWESDLAIPELDKLVAMSRLFSVSLGRLLGVEEDAAPAEELTERELKAVEEIARRYLGGIKPPPRRPYLVAAGAALALVICAAAMLGGNGASDRQIAGLQNDVNRLQSAVDSVTQTVNQSLGEMQSLLSDGANPVLDWAEELRAIDAAEETTTMELQATLLEFADDTTVTVLVGTGDGETIEVPLAGQAGSPIYQAVCTLPLADEYSYTAVVKSGGVQKTQQFISRQSALKTWSALDIVPEKGIPVPMPRKWTPGSAIMVKINGGNQRFEMDIGVYPVEVGVSIYRGDELLGSFSNDVSQADYFTQENFEIPCEGTYTFKYGDEWKVVLYVVDSLGRRTTQEQWGWVK